MGNRLDYLNWKKRRWDGTKKYLTKDCGDCEFYREIEGQNICGWGVDFKYLVPAESPKRCEVKNRETEKSHIHSVTKLDEVINAEDFWDLVRKKKGIR